MIRFPFTLFLRVLFFCAFIVLQGYVFAQRPEAFNKSEAPFLHGVASGDPTGSNVIIWTRISLPLAPKIVMGEWEIALDSEFKNIVNKGSFSTHADKDYTVKVDVGNLPSDSWFYYRFSYNKIYSPIGRTRTMPKGKSDNIRIAVLSCQDYQNGYYNVLENVVEKNNVDLVFFLGDYIYEYGPNATMQRPHEPKKEIFSLNDYRVRYSQYRLDAQLNEIHRQFPFICVWDDHETADNSYMSGSHNHIESKHGNFGLRAKAARQVYFEWLPVRETDTDNNIYRSFIWGDLVKFYFLDTRLDGRVEQIHTVFPSIKNRSIGDTTRSLLGAKQWNWLNGELKSSEGKWNFFAQQIMVAPLLYNIFESYKILNPDQWDGYPGERERLMNLWVKHSTPNPVVLTGDIHTSWANELPWSNNFPLKGSKNIGVEFVGSSVTSSNAVNIPGVRNELKYMNPHIKFIDLEHHGYYTVDIRADSICTDYWFVNTINSRKYKVYRPASFIVKNGDARLIETKDTTAVKNRFPALAPGKKQADIKFEDIEILHISGNHPGKIPNVWLYAKSHEVVEIKFYDASLNVFGTKTESIHNGFNEVQLAKDFDISKTKKVEVYRANNSSTNQKLLASLTL